MDADDREKEATEEFEAAVKADPKQIEAHFGLGYLYWKQKRYAGCGARVSGRVGEQCGRCAGSVGYWGDIMLRDETRKAEALNYLKKAEALDNNLHVGASGFGDLLSGGGTASMWR